MIRAIIFLLLISTPLYPGEQFKAAQSCRKCHLQIYKQWILSMHANSTIERDSLYAGMYSWALSDSKGKLREKCLTCHAPMSAVFHSTDTAAPFNQDGVTCQFCHGADEIKGSHSAMDFSIDLDTIYTKPGPIQKAPHSLKPRDFFTEGRFCLPCHAVMTNPANLQVCATGPEWSAYYEKTRKTCQDCHMPELKGKASHQFPGTHVGDLLAGAVEMDMSYQPKDHQIVFTLNNSGAGHALPTGTPLRMVMLKVTGYGDDGSVIWENWKENPVTEDRTALFMKILGDSTGSGPVPPWKAIRILFDRRLMPGEPVTVTYSLNDDKIITIEAKLLYRFAPPPILKKFAIRNSQLNQPSLIARRTWQLRE